MIAKQISLQFSETKSEEPCKKGRSTNLLAMRDRVLVARYYYWTEIKRLRFDDTLKILQDREMFISEKRIMCILNEQDHYLEKLTTYKISVHKLRKQYPSFNWN